ncbi:MAG: radical SAM protein [Lachnospiraceae bacterium]|nr:radical SAM protein [Lachnospiraceae bacterium]
MLIDRILYPIRALGPGKRIVIWTVGCSKNCVGCANPELREFDLSKEMNLRTFSNVLKAFEGREIDGFTLTGGEPFDQAEALTRFLPEMKKYSDDILIFSGYTNTELEHMEKTEPAIAICRSFASVLITGPYQDEANDNKTALVASSNQEIVFENESFLSLYEAYMQQGRIIENVFYGNSLISVGIHNRSGGISQNEEEYA